MLYMYIYVIAVSIDSGLNSERGQYWSIYLIEVVYLGLAVIVVAAAEEPDISAGGPRL